MTTTITVLLTEQMPSFNFDMALFSEHLFEAIAPIKELPPNYVKKYTKLLRTKSSKQFVIPTSFPKHMRVYIIDSQLNVLFASYDKDLQMYHYMQQIFENDSDSIMDYNSYYGLFDNPITKTDSKLIRFVEEYGFIPSESLAQSHIIFVQGNKLEAASFISTYELVMFITRFADSNYVQLSALSQILSIAPGTNAEEP